MTGFFIGTLTTAGFTMLLLYCRREDIHPNWWQWALTVGGFLSAAFTLAVIFGFLAEDSHQAVAVNGTLTGLPTLIYGAFLWRHIFKKTENSESMES